MASLDTLSYAALKTDSTFHYLPLRPGSSYSEDPGMYKEQLAANSLFEPTAYDQGLCMPQIGALTRLYADWATPTVFTNMVNARNATTGLMPSLGAFKFRYGSGNSGDISGAYSACKVGRLVLSGGPIGTPVDCSMLLLPYGSDGDATALGTPTKPYGQPYMSQGVTFGGLLTGVAAWSIAFDNAMTPDVCAPASFTANTRFYPQDYYNGNLNFVVSLTQKLGETVVDVTNLSTINTLVIALADPAGANSITFTMKGLQPARNAQQNMGLGFVTRTYQSMATSATATSLAIS